MVDIQGGRWNILLRNGWHALEAYDGETFRWAVSDATILVPTFEKANLILDLFLEPGPGVRGRPFDLQIFDSSDTCIFEDLMSARKRISLSLISYEPTVHVLRLHAPGGGSVAGLDVRVLDFRVFSIAFRSAEESAWSTLT
jgi:hypothetical protein